MGGKRGCTWCVHAADCECVGRNRWWTWEDTVGVRTAIRAVCVGRHGRSVRRWLARASSSKACESKTFST
eukprot:1514074-Rhodomonas_salina.1